MLRIFLGISIPKTIGHLLTSLQGGVPGARWVAPENYHITLRFIGDVNEVVKEDIAESLDSLAFPTFKISLQGIGIFSHGENPHSLWIKPNPESQLIQLNRKIENHLQNHLSIPVETRKYTPHLTLAKMHDTNPEKVGQYLQWHNLFKTPEFEVKEYTLFQSHMTHQGSIYTPLELFDLDESE